MMNKYRKAFLCLIVVFFAGIFVGTPLNEDMGAVRLHR
jgi:uncharacterized protein HemY